MATRLIFLCAGATASSRIGAFPWGEEALDEIGHRKAGAIPPPPGSFDLAASSPSRSAVETAGLLSIPVSVEPELADLHFGDWAGRTLTDVERDSTEKLMAWMSDPTRAAPGGESMASLTSRIGDWIDRQTGVDRKLLVVSHPAVMRGAIAHCLGMPVAAVMRIDIMPLSTLTLSFNRQWRLQELRLPR